MQDKTVVDLGQGKEEVFFEGRPALINNLGELLLAIITLGIASGFFWLRSLAKNYRITSQRIMVEYGLLAKRLEQIDLYRLNDYVVVRSLAQRMLGTGTLILRSMDRTAPEIRLDGLKTDVPALYEKLRAATESEKRRRGVRLIDAEAYSN